MKSLIPTIGLLFLTACGLSSSPHQEKHQLELTMHQVRTDLEELKHDLSTQQMQMQIVEGKVISMEDAISGMNDRNNETQKIALEQLEYQLSAIENRFKDYENKQNEILQDLGQLEKHANYTNKALSQYKLQLKEKKLAKKVHYKVKSGDSLEKIAKDHRVSVQDLKKVNHLVNDVIIAGQELIIP